MNSQATRHSNPLKIGGLSLDYLIPSACGPHDCPNLNTLLRFSSTKKWIFPKQVHGAAVIEVDSSSKQLLEADALISKDSNCGLAVFGGDCPGVAIDTGGVYFGIAHCGWRGTVAGVLKNLVQSLSDVSEKGLKSWSAYIGPGINGKHYEVGQLVMDAYSWNDSSIVWEKDGKIGLDLKSELRSQLIEMGLRVDQIKVDSRCTYESPEFHSYRKSGKGPNQLLAIFR